MRRRDFIAGAAAGLTALSGMGVAFLPRRRKRNIAWRSSAIPAVATTGTDRYRVEWDRAGRGGGGGRSGRQGLAAAVQRLKGPRGYADYRQMLEKERPQIVSIAPRWLDGHRIWRWPVPSTDCHVFLEKPMCQDLVQSDEMVAAFEKKKLKLAIAHQTPVQPGAGDGEEGHRRGIGR